MQKLIARQVTRQEENNVRIGVLASDAENADLEARRLAQIAQAKDSPGGENITPEEAAPIFRLVTLSATKDHQVTEQLA